ncbi:hypothetical protein SAMN04489761_1854 [Tenacibaculum sp. MAR_2009_124]|uniref:hypothetical protein n=1 Tax=Tenacibaculum sp. MAR_2009_124 TaxID=1250059 RepID=UPI00089A2818|nr:hypothetical protein [Tenacibaculum sp. MAR_2009_124]SEB81481.1 hypothetical protein SAMN04489761_1854 [Tenacibaculum sp. MAR_2009_124]
MKNIMIAFVVLTSFTINAQNSYEKGMEKAFALWGENKTTEAVQLFERIAKVEKDNWLPPFYVATIEILGSFGLKDEAKLEAKLKKAQEYLDEAKTLSEDNPEIMITQALLNTAYIAFDGQRYGMSLSTKNIILYAEAEKLAPKNPRVVLGKAEWNMGSAEFFNQPIDPYCKNVEKALKLLDTDNPEKYHPRWGKERGEQLLKKCKKG